MDSRKRKRSRDHNQSDAAARANSRAHASIDQRAEGERGVQEHSRQQNLSRSKRSAHSTAITRPVSPQVEPSPRDPASLQQYLYYSQAESTQTNEVRTQTSHPSQLRTSSSFRISGEVPESESELEDDETESSSAHPSGATQTTTKSERGQSSESYRPTLESTNLSTLPVESPPSPAVSIPETEPDIESSPAAQRVIEETVFGDESEVYLQEESSREIPDTFETGGTLSTVQGSLGQDPQHLTQRRTVESQGATEEESSVQVQAVESSIEEELRGVPQGTPAVQGFGQSAHVVQHLTQSSVQEVEPFAQQRSQADTLTTSSQLRGQQQSQTESEEQTTLLDSSIETSPKSRAQASQHQGSSAIEVHGTRSRRQDPAKPSRSNDDHRQFAPHSKSSQRQNAHKSPHETSSNSQLQNSVSIRVTTEHFGDEAERLPHHDSSRDNSPIPQPPELSLGTANTNSIFPERPELHANSFLNAVMSTNQYDPSPPQEIPRSNPGPPRVLETPVANSTGIASAGGAPPTEPTQEPLSWTAQFDQRLAAAHAQNEAELEQMREARQLEAQERNSRARTLLSEPVENRLGVDRFAAPEAGTRSPSTIPDRLSLPHEPTSLRTVATSSSASAPAPPAPQVLEAVAKPEPQPQHEPQHENAAPPSFQQDVDMEEAEYSDDGDNESLLNDDIELQDQEYIVPLPIQGRQADTYRNRSTALNELYDPHAHYREEDRLKIEGILSELRLIETHVDLVRISNSTPQPDDKQAQQDKHLAQWSCDNSIKFRFLGALLERLQTRNLHVILLIDDESQKRLFAIVESFLRGVNFSFDSPSTGQSNTATDESYKERKQLKITILASTSSPILREAHLIICLDGKPNITRIRKKPWALKPDRSGVPLLHMIIPRTVGHIDRYVSSRLEAQRRLNTIITTLSQFVSQGTIGHALALYPAKKAFETGYADEIARFLLPSQDETALSEWPLPPLGNIKEDIEYSSQQTLDVHTTASPIIGSNAAGKRPLLQDLDQDTPSKRLRFIPQEQRTPLSIEQQLEWYKKDHERLRGVVASFVERQGEFENMRHKYKAVEDRALRAENERDAAREREAKAREQLKARVAEATELRKHAEEAQNINLISDEGKVQKIAEQSVEIDRLKAELAKETKAKEDAIASKKSTESTLEYVQDQRRNAQNEAISASQRAEDLEREKERLERAAKAQALLPKVRESQQRQATEDNERLRAENGNMKKQLRVVMDKEKKLAAEFERVKLTRGVGGSTRAASVGARTPRPGSRAASPLPTNGRDRVANLRNG